MKCVFRDIKHKIVWKFGRPTFERVITSIYKTDAFRRLKRKLPRLIFVIVKREADMNTTKIWNVWQPIFISLHFCVCNQWNVYRLGRRSESRQPNSTCVATNRSAALPVWREFRRRASRRQSATADRAAFPCRQQPAARCRAAAAGKQQANGYSRMQLACIALREVADKTSPMAPPSTSPRESSTQRSNHAASAPSPDSPPTQSKWRQRLRQLRKRCIATMDHLCSPQLPQPRL